MTDANGWPDEAREAVARIIDPEAFGLPSWVPLCGADYLTDRDEARDKAGAALAALAPYHSAALAAQAVAMRTESEAVVRPPENQVFAERDYDLRQSLADDILTLPIPHEPALAALLATERAAGVREGMERMCDTLRDYIGTSGITHKNVLHSLFRAEAALRAAMKDQPA